MLLGGTCLLLVSLVLFAWSSPGQALYIEKKLKWHTLFFAYGTPGGADPEFILQEMNPQWDRLIARNYVSWYIRDFKNLTCTEVQINAFVDEQKNNFPSPRPFDIVNRMIMHEFKTLQPPDTYQITQIMVLIRPHDHKLADTILTKHFGPHWTTGQLGRIRPENIYDYLPHIVSRDASGRPNRLSRRW